MRIFMYIKRLTHERIYFVKHQPISLIIIQLMRENCAWSRGESNPCPKTHSLSFFYHSPFLGAALPALFPTTTENEQSAV